MLISNSWWFLEERERETLFYSPRKKIQQVPRHHPKAPKQSKTRTSKTSQRTQFSLSPSQTLHFSCKKKTQKKHQKNITDHPSLAFFTRPRPDWLAWSQLLEAFTRQGGGWKVSLHSRLEALHLKKAHPPRQRGKKSSRNEGKRSAAWLF